MGVSYKLFNASFIAQIYKLAASLCKSDLARDNFAIKTFRAKTRPKYFVL